MNRGNITQRLQDLVSSMQSYNTPNKLTQIQSDHSSNAPVGLPAQTRGGIDHSSRVDQSTEMRTRRRRSLAHAHSPVHREAISDV